MFHGVIDSFRPRIRTLGFLALTLGMVAAARLVVAGDASGQHGPAPGRSWPEALARFRQLSPTERLRLLLKTGSGTLATQKVARGLLRRDIVERGTLEASHSSDVVCLLKTSRSKNGFVPTIRWVIDNGSVVKKGDKLIELDDSFLQDALKAHGLALQQARAAQDKAQENLKRARAENEIDARLAEIALRLAELRLKRDNGTDRDLKEELELKVEQGRLGLRRVQAQARVKEAEAQAELDAKTAMVELETYRKNAVAAELPLCVLRAPRDGPVVYYVPEQTRQGGRAQQAIVAVGEPVSEGQKLLQIPDLSHMQINVRVHEALVSHLHAANPRDPQSWQRAQIRVDAYPTRVLAGHVQAVDNVASQADWFASDVKVFKTIVPIDTPAEGMLPGMSSEVRITAQQTPGPVLSVPVSSVLTAGNKRLCFVVTDTEVQEREVVPGLANDRDVEIRSGLKESDRVLLSPRVLIGWLASWLDQKGKPAPRKESSRGPAPAPILVRSVKPVDETPGRRSWVEAYGLTHRDLERIAALPAVSQVVPVRSFPYEARRLDRLTVAPVIATTPAYAAVHRLGLAEGRFLSDQDDFDRRNVVVLSSAVAAQLFPAEEPLGATIVLAKSLYVVVGVLRKHDIAVDGRLALDANQGVYLPLSTCQVRFGERIILRRGGSRFAQAVPLHTILVMVSDTADVPGVVEAIREFLEQAHPQKDWSIQRTSGS